jgi:hypothetical protein
MMEDYEIMKCFYSWLDEKYGDAHPHRQFMKMAWKEAFKQGVESSSGWVSAKDRLPEDDGVSGAVLGFVKYIGVEIVPSDKLFYNGVTHWQPLPPSPNGLEKAVQQMCKSATPVKEREK